MFTLHFIVKSDFLCISKVIQENHKRYRYSQTRLKSPLREQAYPNILKILSPKHENFQIKNMMLHVFFFISAQNIDCGSSLEPHQRGGSNEYPQSMFSCRNKKNNVYPCKPQFYYMYIKVGFKEVNII